MIVTWDGRSLQWTANLRTERDLLRLLVPVILSAADDGRGSWRTALDLVTTVYNPHHRERQRWLLRLVPSAVLGMKLNCPYAP